MNTKGVVKVIEYAAITDKGMIRQTNQDYYYASCEAYPVFIVCDGMGGHAAGDVASRSAVESMAKYIEINRKFDIDAKQAENLIGGACRYANSIVYSRSKSSSDYIGMGTTTDICLFDFDKVHICHVGDSRVYLYRDNVIKQITTDHTLIEELIKNGTITEEEAKNHPNRHMITRAVGTEKTIKYDFYSLCLSDGDVILMCTDGLSNMLTDEGIKRVLLSNDDLNTAVKRLCAKANENGGVDNITAILIKYSEEETR